MKYQLAQLNIAQAKFVMDDPRFADFVDNIEKINGLAEASPGFVWRYISLSDNSSEVRLFGENTLVNLSVWESMEALHHYVYRSAHVEIMRRKQEWFDRIAESKLVLWWIDAKHLPTLEEARSKLDLLRKKGPSPDAFTFKTAVPAPGC